MAGAQRDHRPVLLKGGARWIVKIADHLQDTLCAVARVMESARDPWWIIGSAAAALHGASPIAVADVDVLLGVEDARRILPAIGIEPLPGSENPKFRSEVFGTWRAPPLSVDFLAGFCVQVAESWQPVEPVTRLAIDLGGATVYVPERDELRRILESFGRPKDLARVRLLAALDP
jgi:hypothetical protein